MHKRIIGQSRIKVSPIGIGTRLVNQESQKKELSKVVDTAIDEGVNFFMGAGHYSEGKAERILGEVVEPHRENIVLATSAGVEHSSSGATVSLGVELLEQQVKQSLQNLRTDYIDLFQLHYYDPFSDLDSVKNYLDELISSDIIKSFGVSNFGLDVLREWDYPRIDAIQMPVSLLQPEAIESYGEVLVDKKMSLLGYTPLLGGFFTKNKRIPQAFNHLLGDEVVSKLKQVVVDLETYGDSIGRSVSSLALSWVTMQLEVTSTLVGTINIEHLLKNLSAIQKPLLKSELEEIDKIMSQTNKFLPHGLSFPIVAEDVLEAPDGRHYISFYGTYLQVDQSVQKGDVLVLNDCTGCFVNKKESVRSINPQLRGKNERI